MSLVDGGLEAQREVGEEDRPSSGYMMGPGACTAGWAAGRGLISGGMGLVSSSCICTVCLSWWAREGRAHVFVALCGSPMDGHIALDVAGLGVSARLQENFNHIDVVLDPC